MKKRLGAVVALMVAALAAATPAPAEPIVSNPFGNLAMQILADASGATPGRARLSIATGNGVAFTPGVETIWFGLRLMGSEDVEMLSFDTTRDGCTISDFAGHNTSGWQGAPLFSAGAGTPVGSANAHMRMIGGFLKKSCGNLVIDVSFRFRPMVVYYAAFFGTKAAPWSANYRTPPWNTVPTGGNASYEKWWNIWGTFDTLGYSNACTYVTSVSCG